MPMMQDEYEKLEIEKRTLNRYSDEGRNRLDEIQARQACLKKNINLFYSEKMYDEVDDTIDRIRGER